MPADAVVEVDEIRLDDFTQFMLERGSSPDTARVRAFVAYTKWTPQIMRPSSIQPSARLSWARGVGIGKDPDLAADQGHGGRPMAFRFRLQHLALDQMRHLAQAFHHAAFSSAKPMPVTHAVIGS